MGEGEHVTGFLADPKTLTRCLDCAMPDPPKGHTHGVPMTADHQALVAELRAELARVKAQRDALLRGVEFALSHVEELEEAWRRGKISEPDGLGGRRSNRNVDVRVRLRAAIAACEPDGD